MWDLFEKGGFLFMTVLSLCLTCIFLLVLVFGYGVIKGKIINPEEFYRKMVFIRHIGLLALVLGVLGQLISLFSAFKAIELGSVEVSTGLIASGFRVSLIPPAYGLLIFILSWGFFYLIKNLSKLR